MDGARFNVVAGPYTMHAAALEDVELAREAGYVVDPRSHFYAWGTVGIKPSRQVLRQGVLNERIAELREMRHGQEFEGAIKKRY